MNLQLTLAARYLAGRKLRTALTTLAIIFGVLLIFGMNTVLPTMLAALQANVQGADGEVDFSVTNITGEAFPADVVDRLRGIDGVRAVAASLNRTVNLPSNFVDGDSSHPDTVAAINLIGVVPEEARSLRAYPVIAGRYLNDSDAASAVISQTLADALSVGVGDSFQLPAASGLTGLTVVGVLPADIMPGNEKVLVNLPQAQQMTGEPGKVNLIELNVEAFADQARRAEIQAAVESALGESYQVGSLMAGDEMFAAMQMGQIALSLFGVLALFMGAFIIFNTFRTVVTERRRDIGMLRALGATRRTVIGTILAESLLQGLLGSAVGLLLGYLLAVGIINVAQGPISTFINLQLGTPVFSPGLVLVSVLLGVGVTVLAGLLPAWNASRITPLEALRPSLVEAEFNRGAGRGFFLGMAILVLTAAAILTGQAALIVPGGILFLVGLALVAPALVRPFARLFGKLTAWATVRAGIGGLAESNLTRQPARVAVTASASMIGLAVIVAAGGLVSSMTGTLYDLVQSNLGSDYLFIPPSVALWGSNVGASPSFAADLRQVEGVEAVSTLRYAASNTDGMAVSLLGIQPDTFQQVSGLDFMQGNESAYAELAAGRNMIVNGSFLLSTGTKVGDTVELLTTDGRVPYRIVAVGNDLLNAKVTTAYLSQENLKADFGSSGRRVHPARPRTRRGPRGRRRADQGPGLQLSPVPGGLGRGLFRLGQSPDGHRLQRHLHRLRGAGPALADRHAQHADHRRAGTHPRDRHDPGRGRDAQTDPQHGHRGSAAAGRHRDRLRHPGRAVFGLRLRDRDQDHLPDGLLLPRGRHPGGGGDRPDLRRAGGGHTGPAGGPHGCGPGVAV